jgi:hypothetical protein
MFGIFRNFKNLLVNWVLIIFSPLYVAPYFLYQRYVKRDGGQPTLAVICFTPIMIWPTLLYRLVVDGDLPDVLLLGEKSIIDSKF